MLKTGVTLGNISCVLLNLIKGFMFVMSNSKLLFPFLICLASVKKCIFNCEEFFTGRLGIVLIFAIPTIAPLTSESLLGNSHVTMAILQRSLGNLS